MPWKVDFFWRLPKLRINHANQKLTIYFKFQGLLGQTSHQVAEQIRLLTKCKFFIEKDSGEKEMAMQV